VKDDRKRVPWGTLAIALAAVAMFVASEGSALTGEREALAQGQLWRLWTAHVVHFSASHVLWSGLVWFVAGAWMEREDGRSWLWLVLAGAPLVTMAALLGDAEMARYGGLSGLACAPLVWAGCRMSRGDDQGGQRVAGAAIFALLALKVLAEMTGGGAVLSRFGESVGEVRPAPWAHLGGILIGAGLAMRSGGRRDRSFGELACRARGAPVGSAHE
jgi:rhomboid family GlyGly-CTERM serine protease